MDIVLGFLHTGTDHTGICDNDLGRIIRQILGQDQLVDLQVIIFILYLNRQLGNRELDHGIRKVDGTTVIVDGGAAVLRNQKTEELVLDNLLVLAGLCDHKIRILLLQLVHGNDGILVTCLRQPDQALIQLGDSRCTVSYEFHNLIHCGHMCHGGILQIQLDQVLRGLSLGFLILDHLEQVLLIKLFVILIEGLLEVLHALLLAGELRILLLAFVDLRQLIGSLCTSQV